MTTDLVTGLLGGFVFASFPLLWFHHRTERRWWADHERNAEAREKRAIERHDLEMRALADQHRGYLAAINQRARLEVKVGWLLQAVEDHADHLEGKATGAPLRHVPPELMQG